MKLNDWIQEYNVKPKLFLELNNERSDGFIFSDNNNFDDKCFESVNTEAFGIHNDGTYAPVIIPVTFSGQYPDLMGLHEILPYDKNEESYLTNESNFESNLVSVLKINVPYMDASLESIVLDKDAKIAYVASKKIEQEELNAFIEAAGYESDELFKNVILDELNTLGYNVSYNDLYDKYAYEYNVAERAKLIQKAKDALITESLDKTFLSFDQVQVYTKSDIEIDNNLKSNNILITTAGGLSTANNHTYLATLDKFGDIEKGLLPVKPCKELNNGLTKIDFYTDSQIRLAAIWEANDLALDPKQIEYDPSFGVLCINRNSLSELDKQKLWTKNIDKNRFEPMNDNLYGALVVPGTVMLKGKAKEYNDIAEANEQAKEFVESEFEPERETDFEMEI